MQNDLRDTFVREHGSGSDIDYIEWLENTVISLESKIKNLAEQHYACWTFPLAQLRNNTSRSR